MELAVAEDLHEPGAGFAAVREAPALHGAHETAESLVRIAARAQRGEQLAAAVEDLQRMPPLARGSDEEPHLVLDAVDSDRDRPSERAALVRLARLAAVDDRGLDAEHRERAHGRNAGVG